MVLISILNNLQELLNKLVLQLHLMKQQVLYQVLFVILKKKFLK